MSKLGLKTGVKHAIFGGRGGFRRQKIKNITKVKQKRLF